MTQTPVQNKPPLVIPKPEKGLKRKIFSFAEPGLNRILSLNKLNELYVSTIQSNNPEEFLNNWLDTLKVQIDLAKEDLDRIPREGPLIIVSNHPFGGIEGIVLANILCSLRSDVKIMTNYILGLVPELENLLIKVDPFGHQSSRTKNVGPLRDCVSWVKKGGCLCVFPAGEVSSFQPLKRAVMDKDWSSTIGRLVRITKSPVLPLFFQGNNRALFHLLGMIHPRLRTLMLPRELINKQEQTISLSIGNPIPFNKLKSFESDDELIKFLKFRSYVLKSRYRNYRTAETIESPTSTHVKVAPKGNTRQIADEINGLPKSQVLIENTAYKVIIAKRAEIPAAVKEIGRLRELSFREINAGTGTACDLDSFDDYYIHMILWHKEDQDIAGAYRLGLTDDIIDMHGIDGLYTNTLFKMKPGLFDKIKPGIELGRSFIQKKYQKNHSCLLLMWRAISAYIVKNPKHHHLFGAVSISNDYHPFSQDLMLRYFKKNLWSKPLSKLIKPVSPPRLKPSPITNIETRTARKVLHTIENLDGIVSEIEPDGKGIPILLRYYIKLGAKIFAYNVDHDFNDAIDVMIYINLLETDTRVLSQCMGKEGTKEFYASNGKELILD